MHNDIVNSGDYIIYYTIFDRIPGLEFDSQHKYMWMVHTGYTCQIYSNIKDSFVTRDISSGNQMSVAKNLKCV